MRLATVGIILVGASSLLCVAGSVSAGLVTWEFAGELTGIHDTDGSLGDLFSVGALFSGQFSFDDAAIDSFPNAPDNGRYEGAIESGFGIIESTAFSDIFGTIIVLDSPPGAFDTFGVLAGTSFLGGLTELSIFLGDASGRAFSSDELSVTPPDLALFDSTSFTIEFEPDGDALIGKLTSLTPEPGTLSLLVLGTIAFCRRRSCR